MSEMEKTPGQILYESVYSTLFWSDQDEETRAIYEKDAAAVIAHHEATEVAGLRAQLAQVQERERKIQELREKYQDATLRGRELDLWNDGFAAGCGYWSEERASLQELHDQEIQDHRVQLAQAREELERVRSLAIDFLDRHERLHVSHDSYGVFEAGNRLRAALTPTTPKEETPSQPGAGSEGGATC